MSGKTKPGRSAAAGGIKATKVTNASPTRLKRLINMRISLGGKGFWRVPGFSRFHPSPTQISRSGTRVRRPSGLSPSLRIPLLRGMTRGTEPLELQRCNRTRQVSSSPSEPADHRRHVLRAADEVRDAEVLVRRVEVRSVVGDAGTRDRGHADDLVEEPVRGCAGGPGPDLRLPAVGVHGALDRRLDAPRAHRGRTGRERRVR